MSKFDLERMEKIKNNGLLIAKTEGNWDMYLCGDIIYSVPKPESGAGISIFCGVKSLRSHLTHLKYIRNRSKLIPDYWEVVNPDFFTSLGIPA